MTYPKVCLRRGEETGVRAGKPWIFENQLDWADDVCKDGGIVDVLDSRMRFAARGYFNSKSKITVRVLTRDENEVIDRDFFRRRIERAWSVRRMLGFENSCRVVFGESDGLPGLTVDKFADCLVSDRLAAWSAGRTTSSPSWPNCFSRRASTSGTTSPSAKRKVSADQKCVFGTVPDELEIREHDARMSRQHRKRPEDRPLPRPAGKPGPPEALREGPDRARPLLLHRRLLHPRRALRREVGRGGRRLCRRARACPAQRRAEWCGRHPDHDRSQRL